MPAESALTDLTREFRDAMPVILRRSPDHLAVLHAYARELERLAAVIEATRAEMVPQTATLLIGVYERLLKLPPGQNGSSLDQRRAGVLAAIRNANHDPSGRSWGEGLTRLVGAGWRHEERVTSGSRVLPDGGLLPSEDLLPGSPDASGAYQVVVFIPARPGSATWTAVRNYLDEEGPAEVQFFLASSEGFILDVSQLDEQPLNF